MGLSALVAWDRAIGQVADVHTSTACSTQHDPLQEGRPFAYSSPTFLWSPGAIVIQHLLMAAKLLPGEVARMSIPQHNRPVLELHLARPPLDPRRLSGKGMPARFGSSIDVGSCVERVVQQGEDAPTPQWFPDQFPFLRSFPEPIWETQVVDGKVFDHCKSRSILLKERKDQAHRSLDLFIGIEHHLVGGIIHQSNGQAKAQFSLFSFGQFATQQTLPQPVQFRFAHRALEAK